MFSKISSMLGKAWDTGKSLVKPLTGKIASGWDMLKNGAMKAGKFVSDNHEAIGSILSGVGNIIGNLKDSPVKQKLQQLEGGAQQANNMIYGGFSNLRPSNLKRTPFSNGLNNANGPPAITNQSPTPAAPTPTPTPQAAAPAPKNNPWSRRII